jgi:peptide/nickel transport system substrate-binding protein
VITWDLAYAAVAALTYQEFYNRFEGGASSNSHTPTDPVLDELIRATNSTSNLEAQKKAFMELQKYENENLFAIPLYYQQLFIFESNRINRKNIPYGNEQFSYDWRIIDWDIKPDKNGERVMYSNDGPVEFFVTPFVNPGSEMSLKLLFDRLIVVDENLNPKKGQLASKYSMSDDGLTIEFVLRDGITWHDGVAITPEDVKFTIEYMSKVPTLNGVAANTCKSIEGFQEYIDGQTDGISGIEINGNVITIHFSTLDPNALLTFSQWPPLPKHLLSYSDPLTPQLDSYWQAPVGSGPYKIKEVNMNDFATFVPYEGYWDKGSGNIEKIFLSPGEDNLVINAEAGRIDYAFNKSVDAAFAVEKMAHMNSIPVNIRYTRFLYVNKFPHE